MFRRVNCTFVLLESVNVVFTVFTKLILRWSDIERQTKLFEWCISKISFYDCLRSSGQNKLFEWCTFPKSAITIVWYQVNKIHCLNYVFPKSNITIVWYQETKLIVRMMYFQNQLSRLFDIGDKMNCFECSIYKIMQLYDSV